MVRRGSRIGGSGCGHVESGESVGTAYLVAPRLVVTSGHVVQRGVESTDADGNVTASSAGTDIIVRFGDTAHTAVVLRLDAKTDVAVLRLAGETSGEPILQLGRPETGPCVLRSADGAPPTAGTLLDDDATNRFGDPRMIVRAPGLADEMVRQGQPHAGTPVLVGERVVGHLVSAVKNPNDADYCFAGLVEAVPVTHVTALLDGLLPPRHPGMQGRTPSDFAPPPAAMQSAPAVRAPKIGKKELHAFISYRALEPGRQYDGDGVWTHGLIDRLGTLGFRCFPAAHVLFGDASGPSAYGRALELSRSAVLVFSERWLEGPAFKAHVKAVLKRAKKSDFHVVVVRLDDTPLPEQWSGLGPVVDAAGKHFKVGQRRLPDAETVRSIADAILGVGDERDEESASQPSVQVDSNRGAGSDTGGRGAGSDTGDRGAGSEAEGRGAGDLSSRVLSEIATPSQPRGGDEGAPPGASPVPVAERMTDSRVLTQLARSPESGSGDMAPVASDSVADDPATSVGNAADQVLREMAKAGKRQPKKVRCLASQCGTRYSRS